MKKFWDRWKELLYDGFLFVIIYEILEEVLEDLIALAITDVFFGILSRVFCITVAQVIKFFVKRTVKALTRREGDDKMKLLKKMIYGLYFNKCTIIMSLLGAFSAYCAYLIIPLPLWSRIVIGACILLIGVMCSINIGWESYDEIIERLAKQKQERAERKIKREQKAKEKEILKSAKKKEKEVKKLANKLEREKLEKMKLEEKQRIANMKLRLLDEAKREYEAEQKAKELAKAESLKAVEAPTEGENK